MDYLPAMVVLLFQMACTNVPVVWSDQKQQLADTLDRLLRFPGWIHIAAVRAKFQNAANEIESFTGRDLYRVQLDLNEEYDVNAENRLVNVGNVDAKYDMVAHLLGCVYTNAALTFLNLLHVPLVECKKLKRRSRDNASKKLTRECAKHEISMTRRERSVTLRDSVDFANSKVVFNTAVEQLAGHRLMLDLMSSALQFLIRLAPPEKRISELVLLLQSVCTHMDEVKNMAVLPANTTAGSDDENYKKHLTAFSAKVSRSLDVNKEEPLMAFKNSHCILPENRLIQQLHKDYRSDVIVEETTKLQNEVCTDLYAYLGFAYTSQVTHLAFSG